MPGLQEAPAGWSPLVIFEAPDQPGVQGYHDVDEQGRPYGRVFRSCIPGGAVLCDPTGKGAAIAPVAAHEVAEMRLDELANSWFDGPLRDPYTGHDYSQVAGEIGDPVQELTYPISVDGQLVDASNFVYPAYFNRRAATGERFDHLRALTAPLTLAPGGYVIVRDAKAERQVFARLFGRARHAKPTKITSPTPPAEWREEMKKLRGGRTKRRLAG
jgi:hypothetical protein